MRRRCAKLLSDFQLTLDDAYELQTFVDLTTKEKADLKEITLVVNEAFKRTKLVIESVEQRPEIIEIPKAEVAQDELFSWDKHQIKVEASAKKRKVEDKLAALQRQLAAMED